MNEEEIQRKLEKAKELSKDFEEPLRSNLFIWILNNLSLEGEGEAGPAPVKATVVQMPLSEFLAFANLRSHIDRVVAVAYHFYRKSQAAVTRVEFLDAYTKARISRPANISDIIGKCVQAGYLLDTEKENRKAWQITRTGERYIEERLLKQP